LRHWRAASGTRPLDVLLEVDLNTYLPGDLLPKMDITTMAHSLEARSPLLDHELLEFAASVPPDQKARRRQRKRLLRSAYRGTIPDSILDGEKRGFLVPLGEWFRGDLRDYPREILLDQSSLRRGYFRRPYLDALLKTHETGVDLSDKIWGLVMLELWHRAFVDV
jgi:asparagine synthase (glutamine-hydrolysing)